MGNDSRDGTQGPGGLSRRRFIAQAGMATAAFTMLPGRVRGAVKKAPSDKLNIAVVGIGGEGASDTRGCAGENIVALCDIDDTLGLDIRKEFPRAVQYRDFRRMLEKQKDIDAVVIATPDNTHAVIAMAAMQLGKHVYVQKPLTHDIYEAKRLAEVAKEKNLVTQMGNQGHAEEETKLLYEWLADGAIGDVTEAHVWTNRPIWPQGNMERPPEIPSCPDTLDWNLFLGPAPVRPYHPAYHPFAWRGWIDFGTGAVGDMGAHLIDHPIWTLDLGYPTTVQASSTKFSTETYPLASTVTYQFAARKGKPPVKLVWYDGGLTPPRPEELEPGRQMGDGGGGVLYYGTKGKIMHGTYGRGMRIIPETKMQEYKRPEKTLPRSPGIYQEWIDAIKNRTKSSTDFSYSSKLTIIMLMGNIATRTADKKTTLEWDAEKFMFSNLPEANQYLRREYRPGWSL